MLADYAADHMIWMKSPAIMSSRAAPSETDADPRQHRHSLKLRNVADAAHNRRSDDMQTIVCRIRAMEACVVAIS